MLALTGNARFTVFDRGDGVVRVLDYLPSGVVFPPVGAAEVDVGGSSSSGGGGSKKRPLDDCEVGPPLPPVRQ